MPHEASGYQHPTWKHDYNITPRQLIEDASDFMALHVQGVACKHQLWARYDESRYDTPEEPGAVKTQLGVTYVYVVLPDGGEMRAIQRFYDTQQTLEAWFVPFNSDKAKAVREIHAYVLNQALDEVEREEA